jgi:hypothetical protein
VTSGTQRSQADALLFDDQGFAIAIELVPVNVELPATVFTVKRTDPTFFLIPDFEIVHSPFEPVTQDAVPVAPFVQVPVTEAACTGEPLLVTVIRTFAVHCEPLLALEPASATLVTAAGGVTVRLDDVLPLAPLSSWTVSVTVYVPPFGYECETVAPVPVALSPKVQE